MVLSTLVAANELRSVFPAAYLSLSMIPYASISLAMTAFKWFIPRRVFLAADNLLYSSYMRACLFVFENVASVNINFYGDVAAVFTKRESAIVLSNHQSNVDWIVITMIANRQKGNERAVRFMIKYVIHYLPLFGWYTYQRGYIYVRRLGDVIWSAVEQRLSFLRSLNEPFWLLIFPEGTRFSPTKRAMIESSQRYCERIGIPILTNVLSPRTSGFALAMINLRNSIDAVYDITLAYDQSTEAGREKLAPDMFEFACGINPKRTLHIHVQRFNVNDLPQDTDALKKWLLYRFEIKNRMLQAFYDGEGLPDLAITNAPRVSLAVTLPPAIFFASTLIAPFFSKMIRNVYLLTICSSPVLILWMRLCGSV